MHFASKNVVRTWLFITIVSVTAVNVFGYGEKRVDLKIGFDLTQGANGAPSLRIRDFQESAEIKPRAKEDSGETKEAKPNDGKVRADSFSDSDENGKSAHPAKQESSKDTKENAKSNDEDDDENDDSSEENKKLSTRGLGAAEYEPEENPKVHRGYRESEEDSDKLRRRRKRNALFRNKGKWRKYRLL